MIAIQIINKKYSITREIWLNCWLRSFSRFSVTLGALQKVDFYIWTINVGISSILSYEKVKKITKSNGLKNTMTQGAMVPI